MQQGRWVSYIYRYRNGSRCENAGFIKVQRITHGEKDFVRIQTGLRLYKQKACRCRVYLLHDIYRVKYLMEIKLAPEERDTIMSRIECPWDNPLGDGMSIESYDGLFFRCDDGELLTGMWNEYPVEIQAILDENKADKNMKEAEEIEPTEEGNEMAETEELEETSATEMVGSEWQRILDTYPKLPVDDECRILECVKITPQDIGRLAIGNWRLGVNTFVSHGYYHYNYLMLGRISLDKGECVVIGVPGVYTNKEKYLANMFGFDTFIPARKTDVMTGIFGYWVLEICME